MDRHGGAGSVAGSKAAAQRGGAARACVEVSVIRLDNVSKVYKGEVVAVRDASFEVAKGEFVFLVGPSGSGKSTLLRLMNRQENPERGSIWVAGKSINELPGHKVPFLR